MDLYSTGVLTGVVNSLQMPPSFFLDNFFTGVQSEQTEEVHFDVEADVMGLAPFVSPVVEGQILTSEGFETKTFKPAYVKPKHMLNPTGAVRRSIGEPLAGTMSPADRQALRVTNTLRNQRRMIDRRLEWMAAQGCNRQRYHRGEKNPTKLVVWSRSNLPVVLTKGRSGRRGRQRADTWPRGTNYVKETGSPRSTW